MAAKAKAAGIVPAAGGALELAAPAGLSEGVRTLEAFGTMERGRFIMAPDVTLLQWVTQVLPAAVVANEGAQFTLADALLAGYKWRDVEAVDLATGEPCDEERGYQDGAGAIPFSYSQVAEIIGRPAQSIANYLTVARRFGPETRDRYPTARFTHYAVCAARDLPDDLVDALLLRAGRGGPDGLTVAGIEQEVSAWRRARDEKARAKIQGTKSTARPDPKPDPKPEGRGAAAPARGPLTGDVIGPRDGLLMGDAVAACRKPLREALAVSADLDEMAAAVVRWLYSDAPEAVILGALAYRVAVETGEAPF